MKELRLRFTGATPLLMHSGQLANPLNKFSKAIKKVSGKRNKTDADHEEMARLEWYGGLYLDEAGKIAVPGEIVEAALKDAAKKMKLGKAVDKALWCMKTTPLDIGVTYGDLAELYPKYSLTVSARIKNNRVQRTRPKFDVWSFEAVLNYDEHILEKESIIQFSSECSMGDWRPKFERSTVEIV